MQPSKSVSSASTSAPLASGCTSCAGVTQAARQDDDGRDAGGGGVGGERRGGVAGRRARDRADRRAVGDHLLDDRHEHGHAEVLERPGVRVAAHLDPEIVEAELAAVALGPEQVRAALVHRDDVLVAELGADPLLLAPDARAVRPRRALVALVEQAHPRRRRCDRRSASRSCDDLQQVAARRAVIDRLPDRVIAGAAGGAAEDGAVAAHGDDARRRPLPARPARLEVRERSADVDRLDALAVAAPRSSCSRCR